MTIETFLAGATTPILVTAGMLVVLVMVFIFFFLIPGLLHWFRLRTIKRRIGSFEATNKAAQFKQAFASDPQLKHLWKEYQDSLHVYKEAQGGQMVVSATRATVPAEVYFNSQFVVDSRLRTDFFKHLPGLFTGTGIIGTFIGLIEGLGAFQVSESAATVRQGLESLMHSVGEAFLISASAIAAAMVVTLVEKLLLASLYRRTEEIAHAIDASFDSGAGEEYLSRLVLASEDSASQAKILKDSLVSDLGHLLRELTAAQIESSKAEQERLLAQLVEQFQQHADAAAKANIALGASLIAGIKQGLKEPLDKITIIVEAASGDQSAKAVAMLEAMMEKFGRQLSDIFGGQISELSGLNQDTARGIKEAVAALHSLVKQVETSGERSTERLTATVEAAINQMSAASAQLADSLVRLTEFTSSSVDKMNAGAVMLGKASSNFAAAGERVAGVMGQAADVTTKMSQSSGALTASASAVQEMLRDYQRQRDAVGLLVSELRLVIDSARREASLTADILARIESSATRLGTAQKQADEYLDGVSLVLGEAHESFATAVKQTLDTANHGFHTKLTSAVEMLSEAIENLGLTLAAMEQLPPTTPRQ